MKADINKIAEYGRLGLKGVNIGKKLFTFGRKRKGTSEKKKVAENKGTVSKEKKYPICRSSRRKKTVKRVRLIGGGLKFVRNRYF